jgi:hypothetical protein
MADMRSQHGIEPVTEAAQPTNTALEAVLSSYTAAIDAINDAVPVTGKNDDLAGRMGKAPKELQDAYTTAREEMMALSVVLEAHTKAAKAAAAPPLQDTAPLFIQLGKMLESTAKELSRKRRGRKAVDAVAFGKDGDGQPVKPNTAQMAKKLGAS